jgi:hypothetical protein
VEAYDVAALRYRGADAVISFPHRRAELLARARAEADADGDEDDDDAEAEEERDAAADAASRKDAYVGVYPRKYATGARKRFEVSTERTQRCRRGSAWH